MTTIFISFFSKASVPYIVFQMFSNSCYTRINLGILQKIDSFCKELYHWLLFQGLAQLSIRNISFNSRWWIKVIMDARLMIRLASLHLQWLTGSHHCIVSWIYLHWWFCRGIQHPLLVVKTHHYKLFSGSHLLHYRMWFIEHIFLIKTLIVLIARKHIVIVPGASHLLFQESQRRYTTIAFILLKFPWEIEK